MMNKMIERLVVAAERYARAQEIQALVAACPHMAQELQTTNRKNNS